MIGLGQPGSGGPLYPAVRLSGGHRPTADTLGRGRERLPGLTGISWRAGAMAKIVYRIASHHAGGYAVEIVGGRRDIERVQSGFKSQAEAEAWVATQVEAAKGADQWVYRVGLSLS